MQPGRAREKGRMLRAWVVSRRPEHEDSCRPRCARQSRPPDRLPRTSSAAHKRRALTQVRTRAIRTRSSRIDAWRLNGRALARIVAAPWFQRRECQFLLQHPTELPEGLTAEGGRRDPPADSLPASELPFAEVRSATGLNPRELASGRRTRPRKSVLCHVFGVRHRVEQAI